MTQRDIQIGGARWVFLASGRSGYTILRMDRQPKSKRIGRPPYREPADRTRPLAACVNAKDRLEIEMKAAEVGMSVSAYLRAAALNAPSRSRRELRLIAGLSEIRDELDAIARILDTDASERVADARRKLAALSQCVVALGVKP